MVAALLLARDDDAMLNWIVRSLLYFPTHDVAYPLAAFGADAEDVRFGEHARLHGVFVPPPRRRLRPHTRHLPRQRRQYQSPRAAGRTDAPGIVRRGLHL